MWRVFCVSMGCLSLRSLGVGHVKWRLLGPRSGHLCPRLGGRRRWLLWLSLICDSLLGPNLPDSVLVVVVVASVSARLALRSS